MQDPEKRATHRGHANPRKLVDNEARYLNYMYDESTPSLFSCPKETGKKAMATASEVE